MSNAVSALEGAEFNGFAEVREIGLQGMITLRGDLGSKAMAGAVKSATGLKLPELRRIEQAEGQAVAWMSPDELLVMVPYEDVQKTLVALDKALKGTHYMAVDVSDARAVFQVTGPAAGDVIAKLAPIDMGALATGEIRRSRLAQIPAAFWLVGDDTVSGTVQVVCFRSVAQYGFDLLKTAAENGTEVGFLA
ncbi:MAG: sarcosine oxidase subunit gamma family protein [Rhodobacterales bacterium]|nr:sarcosine oxidase subunit gamma family protein [Rhodobacterales bacterium]